MYTCNVLDEKRENEMKRHLTILIIFLLTVSFGIAVNKTDSLQTVIDHAQGIKKTEARLELAYHLRKSDFTAARNHASTALQEAINIQDPELEAQALYYLGLAYYYQTSNDTAIDYFLKSTIISKDINNTKQLGELYFFIGTCCLLHTGDQARALNYYNQSIYYSSMSNNYRTLGSVYSAIFNIFRMNSSYEKALEYIFKAQENYEKAGYTEGIAWISYITGRLYCTVDLYEEAQTAYFESLKLYRELAARDDIMTGVAICLDELAIVNIELNNEEIARKYNQQALEMHRQGKSQFGVSNSLRSLARIEYLSGNYDIALTYLDTSLKIKKNISDALGFSSIYNLFGLIFIEQKEYQRAIDSLEVGLDIALNNNQLMSIMAANKHLAQVYYILGNYDKAYTFKSQEVTIADSIYSSKTTRNMLQLEALYEIETGEEKIKQLEKENLINELSLSHETKLRNFLIGILFLSLIIIVMFFYFYHVKRQANIALTKSEKYLQELNATKDKLFSIISHDLRSPFNALLGLINLLKENSNEYDEEQTKQIITSIHDSAHQNYVLLNNLLEWANSQTSTLKISPESFMLEDVIKNVISLLSKNAKNKEILISQETHPAGIFADKNMLHSVLRNLLSNAIKFSNSGDTIHITYKQDVSQTVISVSDSGIGISETNIKRLFHIEDNYHINGTKGEKGSGLGLIICKEFVEKHDGRIWVESEPGKGSTFHFSISKSLTSP